jgi:DNA-binding winged helix-turn-helix (wHTH) protein
VRVRFDDFSLDSESRQLLRGGGEIRLRVKAFDLLCRLVAARPRVVDRPVLMEEIWPGTYVSPASLDELIKVIRRALGDNAREPRYVKTHPGGVGFSFCGEAFDEAPPSSTPAVAPFQLAWGDKVFPMVEGDNLIGRGRSCNVRIGERTVSRTHAKIYCDPGTGAAVIEDLGSENGTFVGGAKVAAPRPLAAGDVITMGSAQLAFESADDPAKTVKL